MSKVVDLWTVQIVNDWSELEIDVAAGANVVRDIIAETEENLTDLLPDGYRAVIRRWDHPDEEDSHP